MRDMLEGETTARTVTVADITRFGGLTGDFSQLHFDHRLAINTSGSGPIAHGLLGASIALGQLTQQAPQLLAGAQGCDLINHFDIQFRHSLFAGDTVSTRWRLQNPDAEHRECQITLVNQDQVVVAQGTLQIGQALPAEPPAPWPPSAPVDPAAHDPWFLEDYTPGGQAGDTSGRTLTECDILNFAALTGDYHLLSVNQSVAAASRFGQRVVQPLLVFNIAFASWLRQWCEWPLPDAEFAGHLGDRWQLYAPVAIGDTVRCRFKTLAVRHSNTRPDRGLITFGLQVVNQHQAPVLQGEVVMMYPARPQ